MTTRVLTFPNTENPLTNGGAGPNSLVNTVSATWTNAVQATAGSPGVAHGNGATGFNDAVAKFTGIWAVATQVITGTISSSASPGAGEVEIHTNMVMIPGAPDQITSIEHDYTATVLNIVDWLGTQGNFNIIGGATVTQLISGDVIKADTSGTTARAYINNVQQATGTSVNTGSGVPGIGFDNGDATNFVLSGVTATDGVADAAEVNRPPVVRPGRGPRNLRRLAQRQVDVTAIAPPPPDPKNDPPPRKGRGPGFIGPGGRLAPQKVVDVTAFPVPEVFNYRQPPPRRGRGPGRRGPAGRMKPQQYQDTVTPVTTINATVGAWTWQGKNSPLSAQINASVGAWTWSGKFSPLSTQINAGVGSYTWQGRTSPLSTQINASVGAYTWAGNTSPLSVQINAEVGAWTWAGTRADLGGAVNISAAIGAWTWQGVPATIQQITIINAQIGLYSWGGTTARVTSEVQPSKGLAQYGVSFRRKRSQMDEAPDTDIRGALQAVLIQKGLIDKAEFSVKVSPVSEKEEFVEIKTSGISQRDLQAIIVAILASEL